MKFGEEDQERESANLITLCKRYMLSTEHITEDTALDHLVGVLFVRFFHCYSPFPHTQLPSLEASHSVQPTLEGRIKLHLLEGRVPA